MTRNDDIMMSLSKQWEQRENAELRRTKQKIYRLKGFDESYPKDVNLLNLRHCVNCCGHLCQVLP